MEIRSKLQWCFVTAEGIVVLPNIQVILFCSFAEVTLIRSLINALEVMSLFEGSGRMMINMFRLGSSCKNLFMEAMANYWSLAVSSKRMFLHFSLTLTTGCVNWLLSIGLNHKFIQSLLKSHSDTRLITFELIILSQSNFDDFVLWVNLTWQNKLLHSLFNA